MGRPIRSDRTRSRPCQRPLRIAYARGSLCRTALSRAIWCMPSTTTRCRSMAENDGFVAWGDSGALVMGHYGDTAAELRLAALAREYTLATISSWARLAVRSSTTSIWSRRSRPFIPMPIPARRARLIAALEGEIPKARGLSHCRTPGQRHGRTAEIRRQRASPDFWAVNTMLPPYPPTLGDESSPLRLPPQVHKTIGDVLPTKGWTGPGMPAAGRPRWRGHVKDKSFPPKPNLPGPSSTVQLLRELRAGHGERAARLRDGGMGAHPRPTNSWPTHGTESCPGRLLQARRRPQHACRLF